MSKQGLAWSKLNEFISKNTGMYMQDLPDFDIHDWVVFASNLADTGWIWLLFLRRSQQHISVAWRPEASLMLRPQGKVVEVSDIKSVAGNMTVDCAIVFSDGEEVNLGRG